MAHAIITIYDADGKPVSDEPIIRPLTSGDADGVGLDLEVAALVAEYGENASVLASRNEVNAEVI